MEIPIYHKAITKNALAAGLDATVYGTLKQGLRSPGLTAGLFMGKQFVHIMRSLSFHQSPEDFISLLLPELSETHIKDLLKEGLELAEEMARPERGGAASRWDCAIVYAVAKGMKPEEVIETGTGVGATSLMALRGTDGAPAATLTTFDREESVTGDDAIPYYRWEELPLSGVGRLIPEQDQDRVVFVLGDIRQTLPKWVHEERLSPRNPVRALVILDSLHTPEHQRFEMEYIWPVLAEGSVVLCDDTTYGWSEHVGTYINCGFLGGIKKTANIII